MPVCFTEMYHNTDTATSALFTSSLSVSLSLLFYLCLFVCLSVCLSRKEEEKTERKKVYPFTYELFICILWNLNN